jgi:hypothetical protein
MEDNSNQSEFNLLEVLIVAGNVFKKHYKTIIGYQLIIAGISFINMNSFYVTLLSDKIFMIMLLSFLNMAIMLVCVYYQNRLFVTSLLMIRDKYKENNVEYRLKDYFKWSKETVWYVILTVFLIALACVIPALILGRGILTQNITTKVIWILIGAVSYIYIYTRLGLAVYIKVFNPEIKNNIKYSWKIVGEHYGKVFIAFMLPIIVSLPTFLFNSLQSTCHISSFVYF